MTVLYYVKGSKVLSRAECMIAPSIVGKWVSWQYRIILKIRWWRKCIYHIELNAVNVYATALKSED